MKYQFLSILLELIGQSNLLNASHKSPRLVSQGKKQPRRKNKIIQYILTFPIRIVVAFCFLFMSFALGFGPWTHFHIVRFLKIHGEETRAFVVKRVKAKRGSQGSIKKQYYIIRLSNQNTNKVVKLRSNAEYPVREYIDVLFFPNTPTTLDIPLLPLGGKLHFSLEMSIVRGRKKDSLLKLYFSSVRKNADDFGVTHTLFSVLFLCLSITIIIFVPNKIKSG